MESFQKLFGGVAAAILAASSGVFLSRHYQDPFPPVSATLSTPLAQLSDLTGMALGMRRLAADIAWIQTLEYYGTEEEGLSEHDSENGQGNYPDLLNYCERATRIDPYFTYVYFYGAGALGWNLNRLNEAEKLLQQGIQANPKEWRLQQYLAALAYQKNHDPTKLTQFLEAFVHDPDCPNLLRSLLANIYKKQGRYRDAIRIWLLVLETNNSDYVGTAKEQINKLIPLLQNGQKTY